MFMGITNAIYLGLSVTGTIYKLFNVHNLYYQNIICLSLIAFIFLLHIISYLLVTINKDKKWKAIHPIAQNIVNN